MAIGQENPPSWSQEAYHLRLSLSREGCTLSWGRGSPWPRGTPSYRLDKGTGLTGGHSGYRNDKGSPKKGPPPPRCGQTHSCKNITSRRTWRQQRSTFLSFYSTSDFPWTKKETITMEDFGSWWMKSDSHTKMHRTPAVATVYLPDPPPSTLNWWLGRLYGWRTGDPRYFTEPMLRDLWTRGSLDILFMLYNLFNSK